MQPRRRPWAAALRVCWQLQWLAAFIGLDGFSSDAANGLVIGAGEVEANDEEEGIGEFLAGDFVEGAIDNGDGDA